MTTHVPFAVHRTVQDKMINTGEMEKLQEIPRVAGVSPGLLPVSVIVPVRNEAHNLPRCLKSLQQMGEVYLVDSQSTDDTAAIAAEYGAKVAQFRYGGGWPKKRQWADGHLTPELRLDIPGRCR